MKKLLILIGILILTLALVGCGNTEISNGSNTSVASNAGYDVEYSTEYIADEIHQNEIGADYADWIDLGFISIPSILSYEEVGLHGSFTITGNIFNPSIEVWGDTWMFTGPLMGDFEALVDNAESFTFSDGHVGLFMESFDANIMGWIREVGNIVTLRHGGDISIFTDNEELILSIVRSLR